MVQDQLGLDLLARHVGLTAGTQTQAVLIGHVQLPGGCRGFGAGVQALDIEHHAIEARPGSGLGGLHIDALRGQMHLIHRPQPGRCRGRACRRSGAGDRRDDDIREQTQILGAAFDDVLLYQDACQRGREDGEVIALLRQGLTGATRTKHIENIDGEFVAIDRALERLSAGDLCLILVDQVNEALEHLARRVRESKNQG